MKRLSKSLYQMKPHYDVVVIGSGYGGSIAASKMARCGLKVCLLEKGEEFIPGEFPKNLKEAAAEMQLHTATGAIGKGNGLYEFVVGKDISVFKGCGLGGTSLVNANVAIEPEAPVFEDKAWPKELRSDMGSLKAGMKRAQAMLGSNPYPEGKRGYPVLAKTEGMRQSARELKAEHRLLNINVTFEDGLNKVGVPQKRCINCGDCVTGCNHYAKNTTAMNYLPDALNHRADIFTGVGVEHIERSNNEWLVRFAPFGLQRELFGAPPLFVKANIVILGAGSLGSTDILLRSAVKGLKVSPLLGKRFTGNGDVLGFSYNNDRRINGIGLGERAKRGKISRVGPCITSIIDMRFQEELNDSWCLEEGSIPGPISKLLTPALLAFSRLVGRDTDSGLRDYMSEKWREIVSLLRGPYHGAVNNTQVYVVMAHDDGKGEIHLENGRLQISWPKVGKQPIFKKISQNLERVAKALGGTYIKNPVWNKQLDFDLVTVHPLGGCIMGEDGSSGVVDHKGQVYTGEGRKLHPGLYVMDGAIIPRSVGTNPHLTISGLAERNCHLIADDLGVAISDERRLGDYSQPSKRNTGVQFTETMTGYISLQETKDYRKAFEEGQSRERDFRFVLTIVIEDIDYFLRDSESDACMIGTVEAPSLSRYPMTVDRARFNLFVRDKNNAKRKEMRYRMYLNSVEGKVFYFEGFKDIEDNRGLDIWSDTTQLYVSIYEQAADQQDREENKASQCIAKGILKIKVSDFFKQLTTMKAIHTDSSKEALSAVAKFGKLFAGNLWGSYLKSKISKQ